MFISVLLPFILMTQRGEESDGLTTKTRNKNSKKAKSRTENTINDDEEDEEDLSSENIDSDGKKKNSSKNKQSRAKSCENLLNSMCLLMKLISHGLLN